MNDASAAVFYFDLETTGRNPYVDEIIEIGLMTSDKTSKFSVLVKPSKPITDEISYLTHITNDELEKYGTTLENAIQQAHRFIRKHTKRGQKIWWIGHNVIGFDRIFYQRAIDTHRIRPLRPGIQWFDSLIMARSAMPQMWSFALLSLAKYLRVGSTQEHRALADCELLSLVMPHLIQQFIKRTKLSKKGLNVNEWFTSANRILCAIP